MATYVFLLLALCCSSASAAIQVRLVDGSKPSEGRVEIFSNNTWWTACASSWSSSISAVVCKQLGYSSGSNARYAIGFFGNPPLSRPMLLDYFSCFGSESNLDACTHQPGYYSQCPSRRHAGIVCEPYVHPPMQVRLMDGQTSAYGVEGRVEVSSNGTWGTICDERFQGYAAGVVCTMLGYTSGSHYALYGSLHGTGSGPMLITGLDCQYSDKNLTTCMQLNPSVYTCPTSQVISVACNYTRRSEDIPLRLAGPSPNEGTVEVFTYGKWRKLCVTSLDIYRAGIVCRHLGFYTRDDNVAWRGSYITPFTPISDRIYIYYSCSGRERNLVNCSVTYPLGYQSCLYKYEFEVTCYTDQVEATTQVMSTTPQPEVENPETATEKSSGDPSDAGANKTELILVAGILGATLVLALIIIILILVFFLTRDRRRGAFYLADANRGSQQQAGLAPGREEFYQNAAFQDQAAAPVPPAPAEPEHMYEDLHREAPRHK